MLKVIGLALCLLLASGVTAKGARLSDLERTHQAALQEAFTQGNRWEAIRAEDLREFVLPLTSLGEDEADWLPALRPLAVELTAEAKSPLEAAMLLNRHLWKRIHVIYSTKREKANQDPLHSMRIGLASCSGLSILLVDACRSIGIPARVVGCVWRLKPGNHSWVEVKSAGKWYPLGAFEDCPPESLWFLGDAAAADANDPRYAIYAARATSDGTRFFGWNVPAENVTAHYVKQTPVVEGCKIFYAIEQAGARVALPFEVNGLTYTSPGPLQDMNDYAEIMLPNAGAFEVKLLGKSYRYEGQNNQIIVEQLP
jgi:hypothetical protein